VVSAVLRRSCGGHARASRGRLLETCVARLGPAPARSFAHGMASALVVDVGATSARVTPVEGGFPLRMGLRQSGVAGDFMDKVTASLLMGSSAVDRSSSRAEQRERNRDARSLREAAAHSGLPPLDASGAFDATRGLTDPPSTTACGKRVPGRARRAVGGVMFRDDDEGFSGVPERPAGSGTLQSLVAAALFAVGDSARVHCGEAVLLTGGAARTAGCADRLAWELAKPDALAAGLDFHLLPVPLSEVTTSPWMGGSVLASAGTLPDLFISAEEWAAEGAKLLPDRCP